MESVLSTIERVIVNIFVIVKHFAVRGLFEDVNYAQLVKKCVTVVLIVIDNFVCGQLKHFLVKTVCSRTTFPLFAHSWLR